MSIIIFSSLSTHYISRLLIECSSRLPKRKQQGMTCGVKQAARPGRNTIRIRRWPNCHRHHCHCRRTHSVFTILIARRPTAAAASILCMHHLLYIIRVGVSHECFYTPENPHNAEMLKAGGARACPVERLLLYPAIRRYNIYKRGQQLQRRLPALITTSRSRRV